MRYHLLDVFTDQVFGGNPLAVFPEAPALASETMQHIAAELGLSETAFVSSPTDKAAHHRLRIFTPRMELPFAGHPTVGAAALLAELGLAPQSDPDPATFLLEEGAGLVRVTVSRSENGLYAELVVPQTPQAGPAAPSVHALASLVGLSPADVGPEPYAPGAASAGVPYLFIPVRNTDVLARAGVDIGQWRELLATWWAPHVYVFCRVGERQLRARMFAPAMGIVEDPATGAAAAALPAWLAPHLPAGRQRWTIVQGVEMGRPSRIDLSFEITRDGPADTRLGGTVVRVGEGMLYNEALR